MDRTERECPHCGALAKVEALAFSGGNDGKVRCPHCRKLWKQDPAAAGSSLQKSATDRDRLEGFASVMVKLAEFTPSAMARFEPELKKTLCEQLGSAIELLEKLPSDRTNAAAVAKTISDARGYLAFLGETGSSGVDRSGHGNNPRCSHPLEQTERAVC
jgi:predicted Zn finger-like uncharacterized protein